MFVCVNHKTRVADFKLSVNDVVAVGLCSECENELQSRYEIVVIITPTYMQN